MLDLVVSGADLRREVASHADSVCSVQGETQVGEIHIEIGDQAIFHDEPLCIATELTLLAQVVVASLKAAYVETPLEEVISCGVQTPVLANGPDIDVTVVPDRELLLANVRKETLSDAVVRHPAYLDRRANQKI